MTTKEARKEWIEAFKEASLLIAGLVIGLLAFSATLPEDPNINCKEAGMEAYETRESVEKNPHARKYFLVCSPNGNIYKVREN